MINIDSQIKNFQDLIEREQNKHQLVRSQIKSQVQSRNSLRHLKEIDKNKNDKESNYQHANQDKNKRLITSASQKFFSQQQNTPKQQSFNDQQFNQDNLLARKNTVSHIQGSQEQNNQGSQNFIRPKTVFHNKNVSQNLRHVFKKIETENFEKNQDDEYYQIEQKQRSNSINNKDKKSQSVENLAMMRNQQQLQQQLANPQTFHQTNNNIKKRDSYNNNNYQSSSQICFKKEKVLNKESIEALIKQELHQKLPAKILQNKSYSIEKIFLENIDYFNHLLGQCACKKCECGKCKCNSQQLKFNFSSGLVATTYGKEFYKKYKKMSSPIITDKMLETKFGPWQQIDQTYQTNKDDFGDNSHLNDNVRRLAPREKHTHDIPINKFSNYNQNFQHWGNYNIINYFKEPNHVSTSQEIQFLGKTNYMDNFNLQKQQQMQQQQQQQKTHYLKILSEKNNIFSQSVPFNNQTTANNDYIGYKKQEKSDVAKQIKQYSNEKQFFSIPSFNGQFNSTFQRDFIFEKKNLCPNKTNNKQNK